MKHTLLSVALALLLSAFAAAAPMITLDPPSGNITGLPGETVGWGFRVTADTNEWIAFVGSFLLFESDPGIGVYEDLIGSKGGPVNGVLSPGSPVWEESFDYAQGLGLGAYAIAPLAPVGSVNRARLFVLYERFSQDPSVCEDCLLGSGELTADVGVTVGEIPEPGTMSLVAAAALALFAVQRRRRRA